LKRIVQVLVRESTRRHVLALGSGQRDVEALVVLLNVLWFARLVVLEHLLAVPDNTQKVGTVVRLLYEYVVAWYDIAIEW
jgi:hypothetical protein